MLKKVFAVLMAAAVLVLPQLTLAQDLQQPQEEFLLGTVESVSLTETREIAGLAEFYQEVVIDPWFDDSEAIMTVTHSELLSSSEDKPTRVFDEGDWVTVVSILNVEGGRDAVISDYFRLPWLIFILLVFIGLVIALGGWKGARSIAGLGVSMLILVFYIVPAIATGTQPLVPAFIGALLIALLTFYLSHGFKRRITVALVSTLITLFFTLIVSSIFVSLAGLFGTASEQSVLLELGNFGTINLRGLLLAGIIIGVLGVLDDVTTSQAATVAELKAVNPNMNRKELYLRGLAVGKEHIAALVNTLVLAYAGAFLPLFLIFMMSETQPTWFILNSELIAEEVVRTLVGSTALLFAVPITTWLAARYVKGESEVHVCKH